MYIYLQIIVYIYLFFSRFCRARIRLETLKAKLTAMDPDSLDDGDFASLAEELQELQELHGSAGDAESAEGDVSSNALPIGDADGEHVLEWRNAARVLMELNPSAEQLAAISSSTTSGAPTDDPFVIALARRLLEERAEVSFRKPLSVALMLRTPLIISCCFCFGFLFMLGESWRR